MHICLDTKDFTCLNDILNKKYFNNALKITPIKFKVHVNHLSKLKLAVIPTVRNVTSKKKLKSVQRKIFVSVEQNTTHYYKLPAQNNPQLIKLNDKMPRNIK